MEPWKLKETRGKKGVGRAEGQKQVKNDNKRRHKATTDGGVQRHRWSNMFWFMFTKSKNVTEPHSLTPLPRPPPARWQTDKLMGRRNVTTQWLGPSEQMRPEGALYWCPEVWSQKQRFINKKQKQLLTLFCFIWTGGRSTFTDVGFCWDSCFTYFL